MNAPHCRGARAELGRRHERTETLLISHFPQAVVLHHRHQAARSSGYATFYDRGDSDPHLADGTLYGDHGPLFCAAPRGIPLGSVLRLHNPKTGRTIRVVVRDRGPDHLDLSRGAFERLGGRDGRVAIDTTVEQRGCSVATHARPRHLRRHRRI